MPAAIKLFTSKKAKVKENPVLFRHILKIMKSNYYLLACLSA
jgi:hypothetical protein